MFNNFCAKSKPEFIPKNTHKPTLQTTHKMGSIRVAKFKLLEDWKSICEAWKSYGRKAGNCSWQALCKACR